MCPDKGLLVAMATVRYQSATRPHGAGEGCCTLVSALATLHSTVEPRPRKFVGTVRAKERLLTVPTPLRQTPSRIHVAAGISRRTFRCLRHTSQKASRLKTEAPVRFTWRALESHIGSLLTLASPLLQAYCRRHATLDNKPSPGSFSPDATNELSASCSF